MLWYTYTGNSGVCIYTFLVALKFLTGHKKFGQSNFYLLGLNVIEY